MEAPRDDRSARRSGRSRLIDTRPSAGAVVVGRTSDYGRTGRRAGWAGPDIDQFTVGGFLAASGPRGDGGPPIPGALAVDAAASGGNGPVP